MGKFKNAFILLVLASVLILSSCSEQVDADGDGKIKIIAAHNQTSPNSPYQAGLLKFKEVAERESNGTIEVEVHAGTIGTEESELVEKLQLGAADVVVASPGFMTQTGIQEIGFFSTPYLFQDYEHWLKVVDGEVGKKMANLLNEKSDNSFKLLGYWTAGVRHFYGKKPLESVDDLEGMSIRTQTSGVVAEFWEQTGAIPSSISWGELYQGLQQDVVDSAENAYPFFVQQAHHTTPNGKYITETAHDYTTRFLLINGEKFDKYSKEHQKIILQAAKESVKTERAVTQKQEVKYKEKAIEEGAVVNEINREPFIEIAKPIQDNFAKEIGVIDMLEKIRELK
ncbi:TRAP transporter substrate-binding protein [Virgibacillus necropolis]|uniref:C4-dicarboxylate ABC transporter substrate-binding protein n=1 Tax=Virgibacillus necropolis TaxID=163877 RepID=A0A221MA04_9BACI|nr:TRAP transporter substrate-binding protein [Virgibacillus necropolis]ASN04440.1 C4-dicarboxylate ABC transporter substrate-binding protein [Virgibacillus necropolis]